MEIYRGAEVPDYVDIRGSNVCFTEGDVAVATFYRNDAIAAAKAILKHFNEECDAAAERDEEIKRLESLLYVRTDSVLSAQKEVSMLSADLDEARNTIARMRESDSEKPKLRQEIARLRSALADAERHRDEAAQKVYETENRRSAAHQRMVEAEHASFEKDEEIALLKESAGGDYAALRDKIRDLEADNALLRDHREALRLQLKEAAWVEVNHPAELLGRDLENTDLELALEKRDRLLDHYRAVVADLSAREE